MNTVITCPLPWRSTTLIVSRSHERTPGHRGTDTPNGGPGGLTRLTVGKVGGHLRYFRVAPKVRVFPPLIQSDRNMRRRWLISLQGCACTNTVSAVAVRLGALSCFEGIRRQGIVSPDRDHSLYQDGSRPCESCYWVEVSFRSS
jgi:hypothetical protein